MHIHLFGSANPTGESLRVLSSIIFPTAKVDIYSRQSAGKNKVDFLNPQDFHPVDSSGQSFWISCAPIWLFAAFLEYLVKHHSERINTLKGIVVCSSSSVITKRFSTNNYDK